MSVTVSVAMKKYGALYTYPIGTKPWIVYEDPPDDTVEGASKTHHLIRYLASGGLIWAAPGKIKNYVIPTPHLWDYGNSGQPPFW